jgi:hypothetical protein
VTWTAGLIRNLRCVPKLPTGYWPDDLINQSSPGVTVTERIGTAVVDNLRFEFTVRLRRGQHDPSDFSVILMVNHYDTGEEFRLMRANGPHPTPHSNQLDGRLLRVPAATSHVHYLTERYLLAERAGRNIKHDGFAIRTRPYVAVVDAIEVLSRRAHIVSATPTLQSGWRRYLP